MIDLKYRPHEAKIRKRKSAAEYECQSDSFAYDLHIMQHVSQRRHSSGINHSSVKTAENIFRRNMQIEANFRENFIQICNAFILKE